MAIYFKGMTIEERGFLTQAMAHSGKMMNYRDIPGHKVDKHSSGGIGDKTSIILVPLMMELGVKVPMVSGRGLGHTGGTVDKLESIPGFQVGVSFEKMREMMEKIGCFLGAQTSDIAPADKVIYGMRDVTETVEEISLITASILSKKFTEDLDSLVMGTAIKQQNYVMFIHSFKQIFNIFFVFLLRYQVWSFCFYEDHRESY